MTPARRPRRVAVTLRPGELDALGELAQRAREPKSSTAARLLRAALIDHGSTLEAARRRPRPASDDAAAPSWLPPTRRAVAIEALRARYPAELRYVRGDPFADPFVAEQLAALAMWREEIDRGQHADPRMELAFAHELRTFATWLQTNARRNR